MRWQVEAKWYCPGATQSVYMMAAVIELLVMAAALELLALASALELPAPLGNSKMCTRGITECRLLALVGQVAVGQLVNV